jgi:hypothetical protein
VTQGALDDPPAVRVGDTFIAILPATDTVNVVARRRPAWNRARTVTEPSSPGGIAVRRTAGPPEAGAFYPVGTTATWSSSHPAVRVRKSPARSRRLHQPSLTCAWLALLLGELRLGKSVFRRRLVPRHSRARTLGRPQLDEGGQILRRRPRRHRRFLRPSPRTSSNTGHKGASPRPARCTPRAGAAFSRPAGNSNDFRPTEPRSSSGVGFFPNRRAQNPCSCLVPVRWHSCGS